MRCANDNRSHLQLQVISGMMRWKYGEPWYAPA